MTSQVQSTTVVNVFKNRGKRRCSCFVGFGSHVVSVLLLFSPYSEALSRELRDVDVSVCGLNALTAVQMPETRMLGSSENATCRRVNLRLITAGTNHLAMEGAPCMVLYSIQTLHAECQMGGVRTVGLRVPQNFFHFRGSELRWPQSCAEAAGRGSAWKSHGLHFSKAGLREFGRRLAFDRLINETEPLQ